MGIWPDNPFLAQIPTWLIVVTGWYVVHRLTLKRDERKEARERVDVFLSLLRNIEDKAILFHQSEVFRGDIARALRFDIQRAIGRLKRHPFAKFKIDPNLSRELRHAITYRNFEPSKFVTQFEQSSILSDIANAVDDIEEQMEREYEKIYL
ncbi:MAG: hypothetical protein R3B95_20330 [Nitrospirales bacterium]|nr:hypothetical protein [Nitrospirales bacterium]